MPVITAYPNHDDTPRLKAEMKRDMVFGKLIASAEAMLKRYVDLANSGDCGFWNPEGEPEVKNLRGAIKTAKKHL